MNDNDFTAAVLAAAAAVPAAGRFGDRRGGGSPGGGAVKGLSREQERALGAIALGGAVVDGGGAFIRGKYRHAPTLLYTRNGSFRLATLEALIARGCVVRDGHRVAVKEQP